MPRDREAAAGILLLSGTASKYQNQKQMEMLCIVTIETLHVILGQNRLVQGYKLSTGLGHAASSASQEESLQPPSPRVESSTGAALKHRKCLQRATKPVSVCSKGFPPVPT